jgi:hypothetical protein
MAVVRIIQSRCRILGLYHQDPSGQSEAPTTVVVP